jgi:hypothetical protein
MEGTQITKKVFKAKFEGISSVGKPRKRWEDAVQQDAARFLRCCNWKLAANDRTLWRQKTEKTKARFGLQRHWMDGFEYKNLYNIYNLFLTSGIPQQNKWSMYITKFSVLL